MRTYATTLCLSAVLVLLAGCERGDGPMLAAETDEPAYRQGQQLVRQGRTQEALASYLKVIARRGDSAPESHLETGLIYLHNIKDPIAAIYHFRKYLELQPNSRQAVHVKGLVDTAKLEFARTLPARPLESQAERLDNLEMINRLQRENEQLKAEVAAMRAGSALPTITTRAALETPVSAEEPARLFVAPQVSAEPSPITLASEQPKLLPAAPEAQPAPVDRNLRAKPTPPAASRRHTVERGDTLFSLSQRYYGTSSRWRSIYDANRDLLPSENALRLGMELTIP